MAGARPRRVPLPGARAVGSIPRGLGFVRSAERGPREQRLARLGGARALASSPLRVVALVVLILRLRARARLRLQPPSPRLAASPLPPPRALGELGTGQASSAVPAEVVCP